MQIDVRPYDDQSAMAVFRRLDVEDRIEAEIVRGAGVTHLQLFAEWRQLQPVAVISRIATANGVPIALFQLVNTGQAGVAAAAFLACDHRRHRRALALIGAAIRAGLPGFAADAGIRRIEARAWSAHPTASQFLTALGFWPECDMPGFPGGHVFRQFAWYGVPPQNQPQ